MKTSTVIFEQLGGNIFATMTNAKNFVALENGIKFTIGRNASKSNLVKILLNIDDTYTLQFWNKGKDINSLLLMVKYYQQGMNDDEIQRKVAEDMKKAEPKLLKEYNGIYAEQLQEIFTNYTKLYTRI
jgi:hypothetical protein